MWKVLDKKFKKFYALKEISKVKVIDKKSINSIIYERELLSRINHPLIINLHYAFQDYNNLYLVLDLLTGGDLRYQIGHHKRQYFSEQQTKFFISCIISALYYIHSKNIIHRDIKPENLVFDKNGYLHITDFGISKFKSKNNKNETSGTPGYMAPEVMKGMNHTGSVDYFAVGVITYELMMGRRPYSGKSRKEIKEEMMSKQIYIDQEMIPFGWSDESADFINKLLIRKDVKRFGFYNELDIKSHPWFYDINFDKIIKKELISPFIPKINHDNYDKKYCEEIDKIGFETNYRYEEYKANEHYREIFLGFTFYNVDESQFKIYKKPSIKYIQNKKYKITENLKEKNSKTLNVDKYDNLKETDNDSAFKKSTIDYDFFFKNKNNDTIEVDNYNISNVKRRFNSNHIINGNKNKNEKENNNQNYSSNKHKRIKSNLINHNFLYLLQKKKLFYSKDNKTINQDSSNNNNENSLINTLKLKNNNTINHNIKDKNIIHIHANSFNNNLYLNLLNKIRKEKNGIEEFDNNKIIDDTISFNKIKKKRTIDINKVPILLNIENNNFNSLKNLKKKTRDFLNLDSIDTTSKSNKYSVHIPTYNKLMMKANTNFYMRHKIPHTQLNRFTPNNLRNKKSLLNAKNYTNNKYNSLNNDKTLENSRRTLVKFRTKSFSKNSILDNSNNYQNILNMISSEEQSLDKNRSNNKILEKNDSFNSNKKIAQPKIKHNFSYSSFNNKNKIETLIKNIFEPEKQKKTTIPLTFKKSSNTLINPSKASALPKKIPIPLSFGKKIINKCGYMNKTIQSPGNNSLNTTNNNSINNSSVSKNYIFNNNTSANKSSRKEEIKNNKKNIIIKPYMNNKINSTINSQRKNKFKFALNNNYTNNYTSLFKRLNDCSIKNIKNPTIGSLNYLRNKKNLIERKKNKVNKLEKFSIKNKILNGQIKKDWNKNLKNKFNIDLNNNKNKEEFQIKEDYNKINNIISNKKISNSNNKNKLISFNKSNKSNIASFSYHSYNSTTSSGCKINNK